jgi:hypothetical protein
MANYGLKEYSYPIISLSLAEDGKGGRVGKLIATLGDKGWETEPFEINAEGDVDHERYVVPQLAALVRRMAG